MNVAKLVRKRSAWQTENRVTFSNATRQSAARNRRNGIVAVVKKGGSGERIYNLKQLRSKTTVKLRYCCNKRGRQKERIIISRKLAQTRMNILQLHGIEQILGERSQLISRLKNKFIQKLKLMQMQFVRMAPYE